MRLAPLFVLLALTPCSACKGTAGGGELTRKQCRDLVRKRNQLLSRDTGGMHTSLQRREKASVEGCMNRGTERAYRCVMQAGSPGELESCELLFD